MTRIQAVDPANATGRTKELFEQVQQKMGRVPNVFTLMGNSPAVLAGYLNFGNALGNGFLDPQLRERIAIVVAETNGCQYCLSAHVALGKMVGLSEQEIKAARETHSSDPKVLAALTFVRTLVTRRALIGDADVQELRQAGFSDGEIAEILANVALNIFTNYFNMVTQPEIDFPQVPLAFPV